MSKAAMSGTVMSRTVMSGAALPKAAVVSLATSTPPHVFLQKGVLAAAWDVFGPRFPQFETLLKHFCQYRYRQASRRKAVRVVS